MFALLNRLTDVQPLYEYPITQLPHTRQVHQGNQGSVFLNAFEFYFYHFFNLPLRRQNLYQGVNQTNAPTDSLYPILVEDYLNSFLPVDATNQSKLFTQSRPRPGTFHRQVEEIQRQHVAKPVPEYENAPTINSSPTNTRSSTLLRKDFSLAPMQTQHGAVEVASIGKVYTSANVQNGGFQQSIPLVGHSRTSKGTESDVWRSEVFARILIAFWLESFVNHENDPGTRNLAQGNSYSTHLPFSELLRCIRMFIKHAHYFANACREGGPYVPSSLRFSPGGADLFSLYGGLGGGSMEGSSNNKTLYAFFALCIDHWPLDASFRLVLETWLSYIQPWRYTQICNEKSNKNANDSTDPVDLKWSSFVEENLRFYTNILGKLLSTRFFRINLSSHKNAYMLYRIIKVLSQENLMNMISKASSARPAFSNMNTSGSPSRQIVEMNLPKIGDISGVNFHSNEPTAQGMVFRESDNGPFSVQLMGAEFKEIMRNLMLIIYEAKQSELRTRKISEHLNKSYTEKEMSIGFPSRLVGFVADVLGMRSNTRPSTPGTGGMDPSEKLESDKTLQYLDFCMEKLSSIFEIESIEEHLRKNALITNFGVDSTDSLNHKDANDIPKEHSVTPGLSPAQRRDILLKKVKVHNNYDGNPDRLPIRSDEFRFLVRILLHISNAINNRWRHKIEEWYRKRPGFAYVVFRQVCTAPCIYRSSGNEILDRHPTGKTAHSELMNESYCGSLRRNEASRKQRLPARIVLRPMASYKFIFYISIAYIFLWLIGGKSLISATLHLLFYYSLFVVVKAVAVYVTGEDEKNLQEDESETGIDLTLNSTILSQDDSY